MANPCRPAFEWTDDLDAALINGLQGCLTYAAIGDVIGCSSTLIAGRVKVMRATGVPGLPEASRVKGAVEPLKLSQDAGVPLVPTSPGFEATCQWIEGEPIDRDFCGAPVTHRNGVRSSYCEEHHERCGRPMERKKTGPGSGFAFDVAKKKEGRKSGVIGNRYAAE